MGELTMSLRMKLALPLFLVGLGLAGCGVPSRPVAESEYFEPEQDHGGGSRVAGDQGLVLFGNDKKTAGDQGGTGLGVNAYLWRGTLDTLSFMPLVSADPFGGVIITDWYQPASASGERFKATAYILGRQLRADGIRIAIFRQVQQGGQWIDAPVASSTTGEIENKVLARARELRAQSASN